MTTLDNLPSTYEPKRFEAEIRSFWEQGGYFHADPKTPPPTGEPGGADAYTIVIPPPNVTGALHGGHALNNTLQDILIRWHRMRGYNTLWMPGTDHAGIATQAVVERTIFEKERKTRHDLGREEMVRRIWEWKEAYGNRIINQLKLMGCSCDWDRTRFTLDEVCARAVRHTFFKLFKDGLIVRGKRLVNWDTHLQTAVADDEVYHETIKGHFYHFKYPVKNQRADEPEFVSIATTRPETMLGDTAVAVHPDPAGALNKVEAELRQQLAEAPEKERADIQAQLDAIAERRETLLPTLIKLRDMALAGRTLLLPLVNREIPLIADEWAKPELGSGCVKITPAHDPNDYEVGRRHGLPMINVMTADGRVAEIVEPDGTVNPHSSKYAGLRFNTDARKKVVEDLEALGLVEKIEDRMIEIGHSDRSKTPIEPFLSDQWFVRMGDLPPEEARQIEGLRGKPGLAQLAMDAVAEEPLDTFEARRDSGKVYFFPSRYRKTYLDWLGEKRDWCISRQLWWGHRIPIWSKSGELSAKMKERLTGWMKKDRAWAIFSGSGADTTVLLCVKEETDKDIVAEIEADGFVQDPDVLDTWFSSALWPHSTLGWPTPNPELCEAEQLLARYYPGSVLSTAREIITLWVARMVLTGLYNLGKVPFHDVYIHAVIQDGQGRPFKKTLGNGFDPVDIIEVYGADALRFTMASLTTETQDIRMPMKKVKLEDGRELQTSERFELGRNFCNKLWNASRFAFMNLGSTEGPLPKLDVASLRIEDRWILSQTSKAVAEVQNALANYQFSRAITAARDFFWDTLCDWYVELVKPRLGAGPRGADSSPDAGSTKTTSAESLQSAEARQVLAFVLDQSLRLLHPFVPYITEGLWKYLNQIAPKRGLPGIVELDTDKPLVVSKYPPMNGYPAVVDEAVDAVFTDLQTATRAVREVRQNRNVPPKQPVDVVIKVPAGRVASLQQEAHVIQRLANVGTLTVGAEVERPPNAATLVIGDMQIFVANVIDAAAERKRLEKELAGFDKQIAGIENKLANAEFISRAPADVVEREKTRLAELRGKRETVVQAIAELG